MKRREILLGFLLLATSAQATALSGFCWDYPRVAAAPRSWNMTVVKVTEDLSTQTVLSLRATKKGVGQDPQDDMWCADVPCPGPGAYQVLLQADTSEPSNLVDFAITEGPGCESVPFNQAPRQSIAPVSTPGLREPTPTGNPLPVPVLPPGIPVPIPDPTVTIPQLPPHPTPPPRGAEPVVSSRDTIITGGVEPRQKPPEPQPRPTLEPLIREDRVHQVWAQFVTQFNTLEAAYLEELAQIRRDYQESIRQARGTRRAWVTYRKARGTYRRAIAAAQQQWQQLRKDYHEALRSQEEEEDDA